jgi:hypothetical protein
MVSLRLQQHRQHLAVAHEGDRATDAGVEFLSRIDAERGGERGGDVVGRDEAASGFLTLVVAFADVLPGVDAAAREVSMEG